MNKAKYCSKASSSFHLSGLSAASMSLAIIVVFLFFTLAGYFVKFDVTKGWSSSNGRLDSNYESESPSSSISARVLHGSLDNFEDETVLTRTFFSFVVACFDFSG
jgi:hypothetical protein